MTALAVSDQFDALLGHRRGAPPALRTDTDSEALWAPDADGLIVVVTLARRNDPAQTPSKQLLIRTVDGISTVELTQGIGGAANPVAEPLATFESVEDAMEYVHHTQADMTADGGPWVVVPTP